MISEFTPHFAPVVVLLFLGAVLLSAVCLIVFLYGAVRKSQRLAATAVTSLTVVLAGYALLLFGFSIASREIVLPVGGWKYFCEIDCHIANSISAVQTAGSSADSENQAAPGKKFIFVNVKTWFDPATISSRRGNGPLTPNPRRVMLLDQEGHSYSPSHAENVSIAFTQPLLPGESSISTVTFEVPSAIAPLRLLIAESAPETHLLIGHENSPLHKKIYFALDSLSIRNADTPLQPALDR
jgi:hypothetical protein